jgi:hypothetical protein
MMNHMGWSFPCPAKPVLPNLDAAGMKHMKRRGVTLDTRNVSDFAVIGGLAAANPWA